jgi:hypothetical protein
VTILLITSNSLCNCLGEEPLLLGAINESDQTYIDSLVKKFNSALSYLKSVPTKCLDKHTCPPSIYSDCEIILNCVDNDFSLLYNSVIEPRTIIQI